MYDTYAYPRQKVQPQGHLYQDPFGRVFYRQEQPKQKRRVQRAQRKPHRQFAPEWIDFWFGNPHARSRRAEEQEPQEDSLEHPYDARHIPEYEAEEPSTSHSENLSKVPFSEEASDSDSVSESDVKTSPKKEIKIQTPSDEELDIHEVPLSEPSQESMETEDFDIESEDESESSLDSSLASSYTKQDVKHMRVLNQILSEFKSVVIPTSPEEIEKSSEFYQYEGKLMNMILTLDNLDMSPTVRPFRKTIIQKIQNKLSALDTLKKQWHEMQDSDSSQSL